MLDKVSLVIIQPCNLIWIGFSLHLEVEVRNHLNRHIVFFIPSINNKGAKLLRNSFGYPCLEYARSLLILISGLLLLSVHDIVDVEALTSMITFE